MITWFRQVMLLAGKDLRIEWRSRTALLSAVVFASLVLVIFVFARDPATVPTSALAPSVLWITVTLASTLTFTRAFALELDQGAIDGLRLSPVTPGALFAGKYVANLAFVFTVEVVAVPLFLLFFNTTFGSAWPGILGTLVLATVGFVAVGTVFGAMAIRTRFADLMLLILLLPFLVPPLMVAVQATVRLLGDRPLSEIAGWLRFLLIYDIVFLTLGALVFPAILDE